MTVLVEACSIIVRRAAIAERFPGGWDAFRKMAARKTFCSDLHLVRTGFLTYFEGETFLRRLARLGLAVEGAGADAVLVERHRPEPPPWLRLTEVELPGGGRILGCHLAGEEAGRFAVPAGWRYETSMSARGEYLSVEAFARDFELVARNGDGLETWRHRATGKLVYTGRTGLGGPSRLGTGAAASG